MSRLSRRSLLAAGVATAFAGPLILSRSLRGASGPNDRLNVGFIGVGTQGRGHVNRLTNDAGVQVVAISDVVIERTNAAKEIVEKKYADAAKSGAYKGCATYNDFRELLARKDIDAVVIATPDHWHALGCVAAAEAKKDIYCEKPLTHTIAQGQKIVDAVRKNKVVFQTGSQQRTEFGGRFRQAVEYVMNGRLGKLDTMVVNVGVGGPPVPCNLPNETAPEGTDWNLWLGPAPQRGYNEILCPKGVHKGFPAWRNYKEYAGGALADMGAHHFDIAIWAIDPENKGPTLIEPPADKATSGLQFTFANGAKLIHGGKSGCTFTGSAGTLYVDRPIIESTPGTILAEPLTDKDQRLPPADNHFRNWLECIKSRQDPVCTAEIGARSAAICHLAAIGYDLRRPLKWDGAANRFLGDDEANQLLDYQMREPWKLA